MNATKTQMALFDSNGKRGTCRRLSYSYTVLHTFARRRGIISCQLVGAGGPTSPQQVVVMEFENYTTQRDFTARANLLRTCRLCCGLAADLLRGSRQLVKVTEQEAQLPQRNSASAAHVYLGWLTDRTMHRTPQNRRGCTIFKIQTL